MRQILPVWLAKSTDAFRQLADRPVTLFLLLLALNALARPYANISHDARLYSLQVLNQTEGGAFADDVFLRYGSQDGYSIFSRIVAPVAAIGGLKLTFFALYLVFNTLFVWGLFRLLRTLFTDPMLSTCALIYLVTADLFYGGHGIFTVHEQFFTPRLVATGLVLHALERLVSHRFVVSFSLLAVALAFHPLMAFGGLLIWTGYLAKCFLPAKVFCGLLAGGAIAGLTALLIPTVALRMFGYMDDEWHEQVRLTVLYNYPDSWTYVDWVNHSLALSLCVMASVWLFRDDPVRSRFYFIVALAAVVGLVSTIIASLSPYALLFQGQPYRVVWIVKILQAPLGFLVFVRFSQATTLAPRLAALGLAAFFLFVNFHANEFMIYLFVLPVAVFYWRKMKDPVRPDWWWYAAASTLFVGAVSWMLYRWGFLIAQRDVLLGHFDVTDLIRIFIQCTPGVVWVAVVFFTARWLALEARGTAVRWACFALAFILPTLHFGLDYSDLGRRHLTRYGDDVAFVRQAFEERGWNQTRVPTVYSSLGRAEYVWYDLHATSYFDAVQTAGVMFNRQTAVEITRRIGIVNTFEMARLRKEELFMTPDSKVVIERLYKAKFDGPAPTEGDLIRLCQEPGLDLVVIPHEFPGLYSATNGRIFVYECSKINGLAFSAHQTPRER
ncbi:MAG: hypothetical protein HYX68_00050 [Planctomycetes bacterium]|nr:hypothetical protein [Planctomycetota bacterium]